MHEGKQRLRLAFRVDWARKVYSPNKRIRTTSEVRTKVISFFILRLATTLHVCAELITAFLDPYLRIRDKSPKDKSGLRMMPRGI
jgi:hypothetical protein